MDLNKTICKGKKLNTCSNIDKMRHLSVTLWYFALLFDGNVDVFRLFETKKGISIG